MYPLCTGQIAPDLSCRAWLVPLQAVPRIVWPKPFRAAISSSSFGSCVLDVVGPLQPRLKSGAETLGLRGHIAGAPRFSPYFLWLLRLFADVPFARSTLTTTHLFY
jgi:hypothetical protein